MNGTRDDLGLGSHRHTLTLAPASRGALRRVVPQDGLSGLAARISIKTPPRALALSPLIRQ
jgi:hypothetical protein